MSLNKKLQILLLAVTTSIVASSCRVPGKNGDGSEMQSTQGITAVEGADAANAKVNCDDQTSINFGVRGIALRKNGEIVPLCSRIDWRQFGVQIGAKSDAQLKFSSPHNFSIQCNNMNQLLIGAAVPREGQPSGRCASFEGATHSFASVVTDNGRDYGDGPREPRIWLCPAGNSFINGFSRNRDTIVLNCLKIGEIPY